MKNFAISKYKRMFAVPNSSKNLLRAVFFCTANSILANNISYQFPKIYCSVRSLNEFGDKGSDSFSYLHISTNNFLRQMPNSEKITNSVNNSNGIGTPYGAKSVITSTQSNQQGCNISGKIKHIKIVNGISANELRSALKSVLTEFIDSGVIDLKQSKL